MKKTEDRDPKSEAKRQGRDRSLRKGFSTGTAVTAAAQAALRHRLTGENPSVVAVRLPLGYFIPVRIHESCLSEEDAWATVVKDAGDDPDVTHQAKFRIRVRLIFTEKHSSFLTPHSSFICLIGGEGVGKVTKPGLPVAVGEPAINPVPRSMLVENLAQEIEVHASGDRFWKRFIALGSKWHLPAQSHVLLPLSLKNTLEERVLLEVEVQVPKGRELARHTLNPRLGIDGGISILGTTGIVKPFSHQAYEETIQTALSVAMSNSCEEIVLSTGGKSERLAQAILSHWPIESFVQIADFFAFAVEESRRMGFKTIVHSVFFGKAVKMAQGHAYTHAHKVDLDLEPLAQLARDEGYEESFCRELASANTARHALELLMARQAMSVIRSVAKQAVEQSAHIAGNGLAVRLLLFDYDGRLLVEI